MYLDVCWSIAVIPWCVVMVQARRQGGFEGFDRTP